MNVDREQQREILKLLFDSYPTGSESVRLKMLEMFRKEPERTTGNLLYLQRHNLISNAIEIRYGISFEEAHEQEVTIRESHGEAIDRNIQHFFIDNFDGTYTIGPATWNFPEITEKGIDFLLGDEGLSSILNTHTVRIEDNSLRQLAIIIAQSSEASQKDKETVIGILKRAPLSALKKWLTEVTGEALPSPEAAARLLQTVLTAGQTFL